MYSLIFDFNLQGDGQEIERYLTKILEEWPQLYSTVKGVSGTYFLSNALGLAGDYSFRQVVELEEPGAIRGIDEGMQKEPKWVASRQDWLKYRKEARSTLVRHEAGDRRLKDHCEIKAGDRTLICKTALAGGIEARRSLAMTMVSSTRGLRGVRSARAFTPLVNPTGGATTDLWTVIDDYSALDDLSEATGLAGGSTPGIQVVRTQVFGIMRADAGVLVHTA